MEAEVAALLKSVQPTLRFVAAFVAALALASPALAQESRVRVIDGDTLAIGTTTYRLFGIDAPERLQTCVTSDEVWKCGASATEALRALIGSSLVDCPPRELDRYGRTVAICYVAGIDLGDAMVAGGWALAYRSFTKMYVPAEESARTAGAGIWGSGFVTPQDWRRGVR